MIKRTLLSIFFVKPFRSITIGLVLGFVAGICIVYFLDRENEYWMLLVGAVLGVVFQVLWEVLVEWVAALRGLTPLRRVLGTIGKEDTWVYISAFRREIGRLKKSELYRNDPDDDGQVKVVGPEYVYGKGDARALAYVFHLFEKAKIGKASLTIQDSSVVTDLWGRSAICLGAHNAKTREIMTKFRGCYLRFHGNYTEICHDDFPPKINPDGISFYRAVRKQKNGDGMETDYGMILKLRDEFHPDKNLIVIAGLGDTGTAGASYFLLNHFEQLPYKNDEFGVLIEVSSGIESARKVDFNKVSKTYNSKD